MSNLAFWGSFVLLLTILVEIKVQSNMCYSFIGIILNIISDFTTLGLSKLTFLSTSSLFPTLAAEIKVINYVSYFLLALFYNIYYNFSILTIRHWKCRIWVFGIAFRYSQLTQLYL